MPSTGPAVASTTGSVAQLGAVCVGIAASVLPGFLLGTLFVEMGPALGYDEATSGLLVASFFSASAFLSAALGRWVDHRGPALSLRLALGASAALQVGIALFGRSVAALAVLALAAGAANALNQLAANVWIARRVDPRRQGLAFAAKQSSMPVAALVAGVSLPALVARAGWPAAFMAGGVLSLGALVLTAWGPADEEPVAGRPERRSRPATPPAVRRTLAALAVATALSAAAAVTLGSFFVNSAARAGFSPGVAGTVLAVGSAISIASRLVAGAAVDRRTGPQLALVEVMLALGAAAYLLMSVGTEWAHLVALPLAFGAGWAWPGVFNLSVVRAFPATPGLATGITQTGTYVGASIGPLAFGVLAEAGGYRPAWIAASLLGAAAVVAVGVARRSLATA